MGYRRQQERKLRVKTDPEFRLRVLEHTNEWIAKNVNRSAMFRFRIVYQSRESGCPQVLKGSAASSKKHIEHTFRNRFPDSRILNIKRLGTKTFKPSVPKAIQKRLRSEKLAEMKQRAEELKDIVKKK